MLAPANALVWTIFQEVKSQFAYDFNVNPLEVMALHGVPPRRRPRLLRLLARLYEVARENEQKARG